MRLVRWMIMVVALLLPPAARAGQVVTASFPSAVLARSYQMSVYLPDGYHGGKARYSTLYLLHGANGDERSWLDYGDVRAVFDRLIAAGNIPPMVVVMPGAPQGWWVDGNRERNETALLTEVLPFVEKTYRVLNTGQGRLIAGNSAGGFGTVNLILKHPTLFAAAAAFSPAVYTPLPPEISSARRNHPFLRDGVFDAASWQRLNWPNWLDGYKAQAVRVPLYIVAGDQDGFDIAYHAAVLYQRLREIQPTITALRVVGGGHDWRVWTAALPEALRFMGGYVATPRE